jgi:hypothetical protein
VRRLPAVCLVLLVAAALAVEGCGGSGDQRGAIVSIYVVPPLCQEARRVVDDAGRKAGDFRVRVLCLRRVERGGRADLAIAGAGARRATEDSASVAYLEAPGPATAFTRSIVEAADVAWVETSSAAAPVKRILRAVAEDSASPRQAALDEIG